MLSVFRNTKSSTTNTQTEEAIEFAEIHDINCMVETFPLVEAQKALEHTQSGKARFRSVLVMK
jgi:D-arabinose 1-dehydrogenase-like Zn-dependent alcohol dehydrogenase